jgi:hypothetical protein
VAQVVGAPWVKAQHHQKKKALLKHQCVACLAQMSHSYNPSYSGGRDQEDHSLKPAGVNRSSDPI